MTYNKFTKYLFFSLPILLWFGFGRYGFEDADSGFLLGLGWRWANGEMPYVDFSYVRPLMSLVHAALIVVFFPDYGQLFSLKIIPLLQLFISVWLTILALQTQYLHKLSEVNKYHIAIGCYLIASASLSYYMLWHTIDGVFYQSIGLYFISKLNKDNHNWCLSLSALFLILGVLSKQNFLATYLLSFVFVLMLYGLKPFLKYVFFGFLILLPFFVFIHYTNLSEAYFLAVSSKTSVADIYTSSIYPYIRSASSSSAIILFLFGSVLFFIDKRFGTQWFYLSFFMIPLILLYNLYQDLLFSDSINFRSSKLAWVIPFYLILYLVYDSFLAGGVKHNALILLFLSLSWSSSVSWGANSPAIYFTPVIVACLYFYCKKDGKHIKPLSISILLSSLIFVLQMLSPYRDSYIWHLNYAMGDIYPKAQYIKTDLDTYTKHQEYVALLGKYPANRVTVLPSMPLAHYLVDARNPYFIDWAMDVESTLTPEAMIEQLKQRVDYVFIETRSIGNPIGQPGSQFYSTVSDYLVTHYHPIETMSYFDIYQLK